MDAELFTAEHINTRITLAISYLNEAKRLVALGNTAQLRELKTCFEQLERDCNTVATLCRSHYHEVRLALQAAKAVPPKKHTHSSVK